MLHVRVPTPERKKGVCVTASVSDRQIGILSDDSASVPLCP
jgi:hypothetical protein